MKKDQGLRLNPAAVSALARGDLDNALVAATPGGIEASDERFAIACQRLDNAQRQERLFA